MSVDTFLRVTDASGVFLFETRQFLDIGNAPGLHYILSAGQVGACTVTLPPELNQYLLKDARIHIYRSVNGAPAQLEGDSCFLVRRWDYSDNYTTVTGLHANNLIRRRVILYGLIHQLTSNNEYVISGTYADDEIKRAWRENAGSLVAPTYRAWSSVTSTPNSTQADLSAYVSTQADQSASSVGVFLWDAIWRNLLEVIREACSYSFSQGEYVTAEIVAPTEGTLEFRTYVGQRGVDRRFSFGNGVLFSAQRGNLENAVLTIDATNEVTFVESLGTGMNTFYRYSGWALDTARMGESPFGRIETIVDAGDSPNDASLTNAASAEVRTMRPIITAIGDLTETDQCIRGIDYNFGDLITVELQGTQYDMRLDSLDITLTGGAERTQARFQFNG